MAAAEVKGLLHQGGSVNTKYEEFDIRFDVDYGIMLCNSMTDSTLSFMLNSTLFSSSNSKDSATPRSNWNGFCAVGLARFLVLGNRRNTR